METRSTEAAQVVAPATREVLHDLTTERGLMDWQLRSISGRDVIVGSVAVDRLQDNRLQRKRKHRGSSTSTAASGTVEGGGSPARSICSFVVVSTASEPTLSMESLLDLHVTASQLSQDEQTPSPLERVYLCLTDAGSISYYQVAGTFAPFSPAGTN